MDRPIKNSWAENGLHPTALGAADGDDGIYLATYNVSFFFLIGLCLLKLCPVPKMRDHPLLAVYGPNTTYTKSQYTSE